MGLAWQRPDTRKAVSPEISITTRAMGAIGECMKTVAKLTTIFSAADIEQMVVSKARAAIAEDLNLYPGEYSGKITWNDNGEALVSFDCETDH